MRMSYNGLLSQPSKLMTRVRLPSSALNLPKTGRFFYCRMIFNKFLFLSDLICAGDFIYDDAYFFDEDAGVFFDVVDYVLLHFVDFAGELFAKWNINRDYEAVAARVCFNRKLFDPYVGIKFLDTVHGHLGERGF